MVGLVSAISNYWIDTGLASNRLFVRSFADSLLSSVNGEGLRESARCVNVS